MQTAAVAVAPGLLQNTPQAPTGRTREDIQRTAQEFESAFVSIMLAQMFQPLAALGV